MLLLWSIIGNCSRFTVIYIINFFTNSHYYIKNINSNLNDDYDFKPFQNLSYKNEKERSIGSKFELNKDCYKSLEERNEENHISQNINSDISISNDSTLKINFTVKMDNKIIKVLMIQMRMKLIWKKKWKNIFWVM